MAPLDGSLISALGVGFLLGLRHALDADHVAAVCRCPVKMSL